MILVTVFKHGLALEAAVNKKAKNIQTTEGVGYKSAFAKATREVNNLAYTQVIQSEVEAKDLQRLGEHISGGAPFTIVMN